MKKFSHILITGASSGLGKALAIAYASPETVLMLTGRDRERIEDIRIECEKRGSKVIVGIIDIAEKEKIAEFINRADSQYPIDLVIANAGISETTARGKEVIANSARKVFDTNISGTLNTIEPVIALMQKRRYGQIAIMSSLASFRGIPSCPSYSASKGAIRFYGEAMRGVLHEDNIGVTVICPGYIKTPMTDVNKFPMPFLMSAEKAAEIIKTRLEKNPARIAFPLFFYLIVYISSILPPALTDIIFRMLPRKSV